MTERPNILLINVDDLGWKDLACMGSGFYETPNIDALARQGMLCTSAYASAANCSPSRANLLTGLWGRRHGILTVGNADRGKSAHRRVVPVTNVTDIDRRFDTLPAALKRLGYRTGMVGKWHISQDPLQHGFDYNVAGCQAGHPRSYFAPYRNLALKEGPDGEYLPERLAQEVCSFIDRQDATPWFLYYATFLVHTPLQGKDDLVAKYRAKLERQGDQHGQANPVYAAMVEALDTAVGRVLAHLDAAGLAEKTLVLFTSDNGGIRAISDQAPLRGGKGSYYEGGIRVPLLARWPGQIAAGSVCHTPITNLDFFPTLVRLAGGDPAALTLDGRDVSSALQGRACADLDQQPLFWDFPVYLEAYDRHKDDGRDPLFRTRPGAVWREGAWKLHYYYEDRACELYDLASDIGERHDHSAAQAERTQAMKTRLFAHLAALGGSETLPDNPDYDAAEDARLRLEANVPAQPNSPSEADWYRVMRFID